MEQNVTPNEGQQNAAFNPGQAASKAGGCLGKSTILIIAVAALALYAISSYNGMVNKEEEVKREWSQVENVYQRRADLIPNLVEVVKGYAKHESETFEKVTQARAAATSINISADNLDEAQLKKFQEAQGELAGALKSLLAVSENYPELKANQNFLELQSQLEGTENRITVERKKFNETATEYNQLIRRFPGNIMAGIFGFKQRPQFAAEAGADKAPKVSFN